MSPRPVPPPVTTVMQPVRSERFVEWSGFVAIVDWWTGGLAEARMSVESSLSMASVNEI